MNRRNIFCTYLMLSVTCISNVVAAPGSLPFGVTPGLGSTNWFLTNTGGTDSGLAFSGTCDNTAGLTIQDATSADGTTDAYDNAYSIWVDDVIFDAPDPVDLTGNTVTAGPVALSGLNVTVEYLFSDVVQGARIRVILQNPGVIPINTSIDVAVNPGSNGNTVIESTSSGDAVFDVADRWVVTSESSAATDPVNTTVLWGPGATVQPSSSVNTVFLCNTNDGIGSTFDITVPGIATRQLVFFAGLGDITGTGNTVAGAVANATLFDAQNSIDPTLLAGISDRTFDEIVNWVFTSPRTTGSSCSLGSASAGPLRAGDLWLLLSLLSGLGLWRMRRRSKCRAP